MGPTLHIDPWAYFLWVLWLLILPLPWVLGALLAITVHELGHWVVIYAGAGRILEVSIGPGGAKIETEAMKPAWELLCALAGPVGSFSMLLLSSYFPEAALIGFCQGIFNLIPVFPLDGGRAARILFPDRACKLLENFVIASILFASLCLSMKLKIGIWGCIPCLFLLGKLLGRKISCNGSKIGVQ